MKLSRVGDTNNPGHNVIQDTKIPTYKIVPLRKKNHLPMEYPSPTVKKACPVSVAMVKRWGFTASKAASFI